MVRNLSAKMRQSEGYLCHGRGPVFLENLADISDAFYEYPGMQGGDGDAEAGIGCLPSFSRSIATI